MLCQLHQLKLVKRWRGGVGEVRPRRGQQNQGSTPGDSWIWGNNSGKLREEPPLSRENRGPPDRLHPNAHRDRLRGWQLDRHPLDSKEGPLTFQEEDAP